MSIYKDLRGRIDGGEVIILDGAVGTQLQELGVPLGATAWAGIALHSHPDTVRFMHESYIKAGVDIITTNTYSSARHCFEPLGMGDVTRELNIRAVRLAKEARDRVAKDRPVYIAGSVSNFGCRVGDNAGSRIARHGWSAYTEEQCQANLHEQAEILAEAGVDFFVTESTGSTLKRKWVVEACLATGVPTWVGFKSHYHEETDALVVILENGQRLRTRLLVGADGVRSWVRQTLGVRIREREYGQRAIVAHVESERSHQETAWQRFIPGGPVALLPLDDGRSSVVWSCPNATATELMAADKKIFDQRLTLATDQILGSLAATTALIDFPLKFAHAERYTGRRYALIGDAAHRVHPLAGQGANLGLLDAAALAETLTAQQQSLAADPGDPLILRRYERWRKGDNLLTMGMLDLLHQLFGGAWVPAARLGGLGLGIVNRLAPVKRRLALHAIGRSGDLPAVARGC